MAKKSKTVNEVSQEEINDALSRFLKKGGVIQKVKYNDNGFLLKNDLALDDNDICTGREGWTEITDADSIIYNIPVQSIGDYNLNNE